MNNIRVSMHCKQLSTRLLTEKQTMVRPSRPCRTRPSSNTYQVNTVKLPKWAKLIPPRKGTSEVTEPLDLCEEEAYLRTAIYHSVSRQIDKAIDDSLEDFSSAVCFELEELKKKVREDKLGGSGDGNDENQDDIAVQHPLKRQRIEPHYKAVAQPQQPQKQQKPQHTLQKILGLSRPIEIAKSYDSKSLPVLLLHGTSFLLDRTAWMRHLASTTKYKQQRIRPQKPTHPCVVWLHPAATGMTYRYQDEVLRQCLTQEPDTNSFLSGKSITRLLANMTTTQVLVEWARHTESFDSVIIYWELHQGLDRREAQDFIAWLADRRANHGIPFTLVMLLGPEMSLSPSSSSSLLRSIMYGPTGILTKQVALPSSKVLLNHVTNKLMRESNMVALPTDEDQIIQESFHNHTKSFIHSMQLLKRVVALSLTRPRDFLPLLYTSKNIMLPPLERKRIEWFFLHPKAAKVAFGEQRQEELLQWDICRAEANMARRLLHLLVEPSSSILSLRDGNHHCEEDTLVFSICPTFNSKSDATKPLTTEIKLKLFRELLHLRQDESMHYSRDLILSRTMPLYCLNTLYNHLQDTINKWIILMEHSTFLSDIQSVLGRSWKTWTSKCWSTRSIRNNPLRTLYVQPRKETVAGLLSALESSHDDDNIDEDHENHKPLPSVIVASVMGSLYYLVLDEFSITQGEWLQRFHDYIQQRHQAYQQYHLDRSRILSLFACGVNSLKITGLIREKMLPRKSEIVYEKTVLVWAGGDSTT